VCCADVGHLTETDSSYRTVDRDNLFSPRLVSMATGVLASGSPLVFLSPCEGPCSYNISIGGPRFHCKELPPAEGMIDPEECDHDSLTHKRVVYRAEDKARDVTGTHNNSFKLSWYPDPSTFECKPATLKTLDCSMTLAQYQLHIGPSTQTRSINVTVDKDDDAWPEEGIPTSFYYEAFDANETLRDPVALAYKFPLAQAYAISRVAILALTGEVTLSK